MLQWHVCRNKIKKTKKNSTRQKTIKKLSCSRGWVCEVLREKIKGGTSWGDRSGTGLQSSVGGFAYSTGWSAEFSGNSVLCGTGHCGRNLVNRVCRCSCGVSGLGACAAGEGAWGGRDGGRVFIQAEMAGARWALCDYCLSQHALSCTWLLPQPRLPSSLDFHQHSQTLRCKLFEFVLPFNSLE